MEVVAVVVSVCLLSELTEVSLKPDVEDIEEDLKSSLPLAEIATVTFNCLSSFDFFDEPLDELYKVVELFTTVPGGKDLELEDRSFTSRCFNTFFTSAGALSSVDFANRVGVP